MRLLRRISYLLKRRRREAELAEELEFHRALAEQEQREFGTRPDRVRQAVSAQMGNATLAQEAARNIWFPAAIEGFFRDLHYAWRGLIHNKALFAVACLSLGLSTGFGTALFSVVNAVVLQPLTAARPDALVRLWVGNSNRISWLNLRDLCEDTPGVACAGYRTEELMWRDSDEPVRWFGQAVSANYFTMLGIHVAQGRVFTPASVRQSPDTVVVTHAFWQRQLNADPSVLGRELVLSGHPYTVIGVLPRGFRSTWGLGIAPSLYLPAGSAVRPATSARGDTQYEILGVLAPGQSPDEFRARVMARSKALQAAYPEDDKDFSRVQVFPVDRFGFFVDQQKGEIKVLLLFASLLIVFALMLAVVACINVAGMLVARAVAREHEIAIRLSIGCGRWRLARLLFAESFLLAVSGTALGAAISVAVARALVAVPIPFPIPFEVEVSVDTHLLAYLAALVTLATLVAGIAPVLQAWRVAAPGGSASAPRTVGLRRWSLRSILIAGQVAVSTVLLVATTLFIRSLWAASQIDPGFDMDRVATVEVDLQSAQLAEAQVGAYYRDAVDRLKQTPGVSGVSGAAIVPLSMDSSMNSLLVERGGKTQAISVTTNWILPGYFQVMGIPLRTGREFAETDRLDNPRAAIVNETFARQMFPGGNALGQRIRRPSPEEHPEPWAEIIGVAADSRYLTLGEETRPLVYWPSSPNAGGVILHVRTEGDAAALARTLPDILKDVDSRVSTRVRPLRSVMAVALFPAQAAAVLLAGLGLVGWALTITGLYGVVAYTVTRRVPEIGLRVALGASPWNVMRVLLRDGLAITAAGLLTGLALAAAATPLLGIFLAGVPPHDPASFALVAAGLAITALAASYLPARRGMRLTPMDALRNE